MAHIQIDEKCTVLVCSCDAYSDLWDPFFYLFHTYWPQCQFKVLLSTESKDYQNGEIDIEVVHPKDKKDVPWGKRIKLAVKKINTPYIILLLDDFFLTNFVDTQKIETCIKWLDENEDIANFSFVPSLWKDSPDRDFPGFELRPNGGRYKVNCQAGLWRTEMLYELIKPYEDPWEFEWRASCRSDLKPWRFYAAAKPKPWVFDYDFSSGGGGVHRGKWTTGVKTLFDKHNIKMDFSLRGWDDEPASPLGGTKDNPEPDRHTVKLHSKIKHFILHWPAYIKAYLR